MRNEDISDGRIQDTSGEVIYKVKFKALVFRPFRGEVLDGTVYEVSSNGIMIESGPLRSFISNLVKPSFYKQSIQRVNNSYFYDQTHNQFVSKDDPNLKIHNGSEIRYKLDQIKYDKGDFVIFLLTLIIYFFRQLLAQLMKITQAL